jgi:hypothetical protein
MNFVSQWLSKTKTKLGTVGSFFEFLWARKLWWLVPLFLVLFTIGIVLVISQGSALAPFIYTLF